MSTPHASSPDYHGRLRALSAEVQQKIDIAVLRERNREREECALIAEAVSGGEELEFPGVSEFVRGYYSARAHIAERIRRG